MREIIIHILTHNTRSHKIRSSKQIVILETLRMTAKMSYKFGDFMCESQSMIHTCIGYEYMKISGFSLSLTSYKAHKKMNQSMKL